MSLTVCVLIPTYAQKASDIPMACDALGVTGRVLVSNQCSESAVYEINDRIQLLNVTSIGVSANRNNLLAHAAYDFNLFIDDDCVLCPDYESIIIRAFQEHPDAEAILFSRNSQDNRFGVIRLKNRRVRRFSDVSSMGAPGIVLRRETIRKYHLAFNEKLGSPNYFYNGEDSAFLMQMIRKKVVMYTSSIPLFTLPLTQKASSYFAGFDQHFFESIGGVHYYLHRFLYPLYHVKRAAYYFFKEGVCPLTSLRYMARGKKKMKAAFRAQEIYKN